VLGSQLLVAERCAKLVRTKSRHCWHWELSCQQCVGLCSGFWTW